MAETEFRKHDTNEVKGEFCPVCQNRTLTLRETVYDIPNFGNAYLFSMICESCKYKKTDVELENTGKKVKITLDINSEEDLNIMIIKSADAKLTIPRIANIEPGPASEGYITTVEGVLQRIKKVIENNYGGSDDSAERKKAKNLIKKLNNVLVGRDSVKMIIEDPAGNSAILSDKAVRK